MTRYKVAENAIYGTIARSSLSLAPRRAISQMKCPALINVVSRKITSTPSVPQQSHSAAKSFTSAPPTAGFL